MALILKAPDTHIRKALYECLLAAEIEVQCQDGLPNEYSLVHQESSDSYHLSSPFRVGDILDQARSIMKTTTDIPAEICIQNAVFKPETSVFENGSNTIDLTEKECDLLIELWRAHPNSVSKEELLHSIWEYQTELETHTLETHIYRLRQKIETDPAKPDLLLTDKNGYRLAL